MRERSLCLALATALGFAGVAHATVVLGNGEMVNLATLLGAGSDRQFCVGDKLFTIESYSSSQFDPALFHVIGFVSASPGTYGLPNIGFDITGPFGDGSPGDMIVHEMNIQYTVEIKPEYVPLGYRIHDNLLTFNGSSSGDGSFARVDESVLDFYGNTLLGQKSVFDIAGPPHQTRLQDSLIFGPPGYLKLEVNKDIKMFAAHVNDTATASWVRQEFSQVPNPVGASLLAMAGLFATRRRR